MVFNRLLVGAFLICRSSIKVLIKVIQFPGEGCNVLFGRLAGFPQGFLFSIERIVVVAEFFDIKVFEVNAKAFQHIFSTVMEQ